MSTLYAQVVAEQDRDETDRALDPGRKPIELLSFYQVKPKMQIAELAAGGGYTTELLARTVGPEGKVYGQNTPFILKRFAEQPWSARLQKSVMSNVERIDSELEDPLPGHHADLDAVFLVLFYHDTVWFQTNRAQMNQAIYAAIKPGGFYAVIDHSARAFDGTQVAKTLHRIEEKVVISEVTAAGFVLEKSGDFLRNAEDTRDWSASPSQAGELRGESDRFVLLFRKPASAPTERPIENRSPTTCTEPRSSKCTKEYKPVCATVDTGVRCITTPCPNTENRTFENACVACADPRVISLEPGACPTRGEDGATTTEKD